MVTITNGFLNKATLLAIAAAGLVGASSCHSEFQDSGASEASVRLILDASIDTYRGSDTRSETHEWSDGDRIYFHLQGENRSVTATAVFDGDAGDWKIETEGSFPAGQYSGRGVYIDGATENSGDGLTLTSDVAVYIDSDVKCEKTATYVMVTARLSPMLGRLRFSSPETKTFVVSGIEHVSKMRFSDLEFEISAAPQERSISDDGFSSYIYGSMPATSRAISVAYEHQLYTATFSERILDAGQSGYVDLPTETSHSGWDLIKQNIPTLAPLEAFDIGVHAMTLSSSVLDSGNGTVSECGFVYSLSPAPTINDAKAIYGRPTGGSFTKTLTGLEENTAYHIRAYAINESGVAYSEEKIVSTVAIGLPEVSSTSVSIKEGQDNASFSAQIVSESNGKVTECGFCYATHQKPSITDNKVQCDVSPTFGCTVNSLVVGTRYYVRAYARNEKGVAYGEQTSFIGGGGKPSDDDLPRPNLIIKKQ